MATAWTLNAAGPTTGVTGATGSATVTSVPVNAGSVHAVRDRRPHRLRRIRLDLHRRHRDGWQRGRRERRQRHLHDQQQRPVAPRLTLVKTVTNDNGGTAVPTAWTLDGDRTDPDHRHDRLAAVTDAPVSAGTYALSESGGPAGYTAGAWSCTAGTLTGASPGPAAQRRQRHLHDQQQRPSRHT